MARPLNPATTVAARVNGGCQVYAGQGVGPGGGTGSLQYLGILTGDVEFEIEKLTEDIRSAVAGPYLPADVQTMGQRARFNIELTYHDPAIVANWCEILADESAQGQQPTIGLPLGALNYTARIVFTSPIQGLVFRFLNCFMKKSRIPKSTVATRYSIDVEAFTYIGNAAASTNLPLYDFNNA